MVPELAGESSVDDAPADPLTASASHLSDRVRQARTGAKLTKSDLARRVGVCRSAAVQWERPDGTSPTVSNLARIAEIADVAFEWLATGRGPPTPGFALTDAGPIAITRFEERLLAAVRAVPVHYHEVLERLVRVLSEAQ
jgi:transcriptional regulator with XRE-family HTH domain